MPVDGWEGKNVNASGKISEYSHFLLRIRGDLLRSVPHIKNGVKINLQEYIDHTG